MSWKETLKTVIDDMTEGYIRYKNIRSRVVNDIKDILQYAANSATVLEYAGNNSPIYNNSQTYSGTATRKAARAPTRTTNPKYHDVNNTVTDNTPYNTNNATNTNNKDNNHKDLITGIKTIRNDLNVLESIVLDTKNNNDKKYSNDTKYSTDKKKSNTSSEKGIYVAKETLAPEGLSKIIDIKNKYFWKTDTQLQEIIKKETDTTVPNISSLLKEAMGLKVNNPEYANIARINYDSSIASQDMKADFIRAYTSSDKTLKDVSAEFEKKYGMHISASTISRNARAYLLNQGLDFKNRKEAKKYYQNT